MDSGLGEEVVVLKVPGLAGSRLVFASTGPVNRDYDDVRRFSDAAANAIKRSVGGTWFLCILLQVTSCWPSPAFLSAGPWRQACSAHCWCALHTRTIQTVAWWLHSEHFMHSTWWEGRLSRANTGSFTLLATTHGHFNHKWTGLVWIVQQKLKFHLFTTPLDVNGGSGVIL